MRPGWLLVMVALALGCAGCRLAPAGFEPSSTSSVSTDPMSASPQQSDAAEPAVVVDAEAPYECGFPPGTALEYAGRSTTAALDVQEAVGDPMSDDPADIYITHEKFDQGDLHGRLVCAVYVNSPGFVEVTVHPEDGGRFVPPTPYPSTTPPAEGQSEHEAIDVALAQLADPEGFTVTLVDHGPIALVMPDVLDDPYYEWAQGLQPDRWVWRIFLVRGDEGIDVIVDYVDGLFLGTIEYIVN